MCIRDRPRVRAHRVSDPGRTCYLDRGGRRQEGGLLTLPCGGIIRIRFKGTLSPAPHVSTRCAGPLTLGSQGTAIDEALQSAPLTGLRNRPAARPGGGPVVFLRNRLVSGDCSKSIG